VNPAWSPPEAEPRREALERCGGRKLGRRHDEAMPCQHVDERQPPVIEVVRGGGQVIGIDLPRGVRQLGVVGADVAVAEEADLDPESAARRRELARPAGRHHPAGAPTLIVGQRGVRQVDQDRESAVVGAGPEDPPDQLDQLVGRQTIHCDSPRLMLTRMRSYRGRAQRIRLEA
jgi:hypothetical protein